MSRRALARALSVAGASSLQDSGVVISDWGREQGRGDAVNLGGARGRSGAPCAMRQPTPFRSHEQAARFFPPAGPPSEIVPFATYQAAEHGAGKFSRDGLYTYERKQRRR
jgi:hypothetical protein